MKKRILALLLSVMMVTGSPDMPVCSVYAAPECEVPGESVSESAVSEDTVSENDATGR